MENTKSSGGIKGLFKSIGTQKLIAVIALVAIYLFFAIASKDFRSWSTLVSIFDMSYYIGFMAIGVTFVIITGGIDLSIGTVCICSGLIGGQLYKMGVPIALCLIITILIGIVFGLLNGLMVSIMKLPAFIATLGTMMVTRGLGSIGPVPSPSPTRCVQTPTAGTPPCSESTLKPPTALCRFRSVLSF